MTERASTTPTMEQVHAYLLKTGWERRPDNPPGTQHWFNPPRADYPDDTMTLWDNEPDPTNGGLLEILASDEGRCEHEVLADILGRPDPATLLRHIATLERDLTVLARVGDLYLRSLDDDPENEYLTLGSALLVTEIREAVERQGYDVRWEREQDGTE